MHNLIIIFLIVVNLTANAVVPAVDEAQLLATRSAGKTVYSSCILTPPVTNAQKLVCEGLYNTYKSALTLLNAPFPLIASIDPSPYTWSPYDICKYEPAHFVYPPEGGSPICPVLPT
jgi:hypothetical protein